jgi:outer membrane protein assembly factor BamB
MYSDKNKFRFKGIVLSIFLFSFLVPTVLWAQSLKWTFQTGARIWSSPAVGAYETIYVGSNDGFFYAIEPDGTELWKYHIGDYVTGGPCFNTNWAVVYVGSWDFNVYAFQWDNVGTGFTFTTGDVNSACPAVSKNFDVLYVTSQNGYIYAVDQLGTEIWRFYAGYRISSPAVGTDGTIYVAGLSLYALNTDGTLKWEFPTGGELNSNLAIDHDGVIYVGTIYEALQAKGVLYAVNPDGTQKWERRATEERKRFSSPIIGPEGVIYTRYKYSLYALNPDGTTKWEKNVGEPGFKTTAAIDNTGTIWIGGSKLYALNPDDGSEKWSYQTGGMLTSDPVIDENGNLYIGCIDGKLYAIDTGATGPSRSDVSAWSQYQAGPSNSGHANEPPPPPPSQCTSTPAVIGDSGKPDISLFVLSVLAMVYLAWRYKWRSRKIR